ncbi:uncharacterized protein LOC119554060 isoform X2 [Drosophila subpulchrella]|uniref:uncharacterized protein LOC119554060 isoform X1 n=1 Tax=Drosophila subpulchrella TaxID=1486046 RepID=UPI0018A1328D|nr:uncharacterized protein LOC119554060 isoform X1 [Drosophila subpulchrella]XP_037720730.1 uncharacterized protein LOC119554060 isoform X2 [Drosophila subpulchrella]
MGTTSVRPYSEAESKALKRFMRSYRKHHADMDEEEVKRSGENAWGKLLPQQKKHFEVRPRVIAVKRKLIVKRKLSTKQKKSVCGMRSPAQKSKIRARRAPPNPVMSTAFINFLREHQKRNAHLTVKKRLQKGAVLWSKLNKQQQNQYRKMGDERKRK